MHLLSFPLTFQLSQSVAEPLLRPSPTLCIPAGSGAWRFPLFCEPLCSLITVQPLPCTSGSFIHLPGSSVVFIPVDLLIVYLVALVTIEISLEELVNGTLPLEGSMLPPLQSK